MWPNNQPLKDQHQYSTLKISPFNNLSWQNIIVDTGKIIYFDDKPKWKYQK